MIQTIIQVTKTLSLAAVLSMSSAWADEYELTPRERSHVYLQSEASATARDKEENGDGYFKHNRFAVGGYLPLYSRFSEDSEAKYFKWGVDSQVQHMDVETNLYRGDLQYTGLNLGLSNWLLLKNNEMLFFRLGYTGVEESRDARLQNINAAGIATYRWNEKLSWLYGLYYGHALAGAPVFLPVLGLRSTLDERWSLKFILPLSLTATYKHDDRNLSLFFIRPDSLRLPLKNESRFSGQDEDLVLRSRRWKFGSERQYRFSENWLVAPEVGFIGRQKNSIEDDDRNKVVSSEEKGSMYFLVRLEFKPGG